MRLRYQFDSPRVRRGFLVLLALLIASAALFVAQQAQSQVHVERMTVEQWANDIDHLQRHLVRHYGRAPSAVDPRVLGDSFDDLNTRLPELSGMQVVMELSRILALLHDGHTSVALYDPPLALRRIPIFFYFYGNDLRINFADRSFSHLVGAKVERIAGHTPAELIAKLSPYIARDNDQEILHYLPQLLATPAVLHAVGLISSAEVIPLEVVRADGESASVVVAPLSTGKTADMVFARPMGDATPLYARASDRHYWFRALPDRQAVYVKLNVTNNDRSGPSIRDTAKAIEQAVARGTWHKLVFDLRHNTGGNFHRADPFVELARRFSAAQPDRRVYAIVSRHTFSAALVTAMRLHAEAGARIVGETPRGRPNFTYNRETIGLPNSGIAIEYTDEFRMVVEAFGSTTEIPLDMQTLQTLEDYRSGSDPVLERILEQ